MALTLEELEIKFGADVANIKRDMDAMRRSMLDVDRQAGILKKRMFTLGKAFKTFVIGTGLRKGFGLVKSSALLANEITESENLFEVSMQSMGAKAKKWSEQMRDDLGLNAFALRKNIGTMNVMLKSMGFGTKEAYKIAEDLTMLSEDMASFYNLKSEESFAKLQSGLTGIALPLKQLGILIDDETIKQAAYQNGIAKTGAELTAKEKVLARYYAIMQQTSAAQGDLARTIDSPANQLRVLGNSLYQAKAALGQAFQPIQRIAMPLLNSLARSAMVAAQAITYFMQAMTGFTGVNIFAKKSADKSTKSQQNLSASLDSTAKALRGAGGAAKKAAKDANVGLKAFDEINKLADEKTKTGGGGGGKALDELEPPKPDKLSDFAEGLQVVSEKVKRLAEDIKKFFEGIKNSFLGRIVGTAFDGLKALYEDVLKPIGLWALEDSGRTSDVLAALAISFMGFKHIGFIGGIVGGLGYTVASALYRMGEAAVQADLEKRFGSIELSMEELRTALSGVKAPFTDAARKIKEGREELQRQFEDLSAKNNIILKKVMAVKFNLMGLSQEDFENLRMEIESRIKDGTVLLQSAKAHSLLSLDLIFGDGEKGKALKDLVGKDWEIIEARYRKKGESLVKLLAEGLASGMSEADKQKAIAAHLQDMAEIERTIGDSEAAKIKFKIKKLEMEFAKGELSYSTLVNYRKALKEQQDKLNENHEASIMSEAALALNLRKVALGRDLTDEELDEVFAPFLARVSETKFETDLDIQANFGSGIINSIREKFPEELKKGGEIIQLLTKDWKSEAMQKLLNDGWTSERLSTERGQKEIQGLVSSMLTKAFSEIDFSKTRGDTVKKLFGDLKLDERSKEITELIQSAKKLGLQIPKALTDELKSIETLRMMQSSANSLFEILDKYIAEGDLSPAMRIVLETLKDELSRTDEINLFAARYGQGAINALKTALEEGRITKEQYNSIIKAGLEVSLTELEQKAKTGGDSAVAAFAHGLQLSKNKVTKPASDVRQAAVDVLGNSDAAHSAGSNLGKGFASGIRSQSGSVADAARAIAGVATRNIKQTLLIRSPSRIGTGLGHNFGGSFAGGIGDMVGDVEKESKNLGFAALKNLDVENAVKPFSFSLDSTLKSNIKDFSAATDNAGGGLKDLIATTVREMAQLLKFDMVMDGRTLGQATIKAVNEEQRLTGRILLDM